MKVQILAHTPNLEEIIATGAKTCYSKMTLSELAEKTSSADNDKFIQNIINIGHMSVLEHATFTFAVEEVSRALLAQITRHRFMSFSVSSQRYVPLKDRFGYVVPLQILDNQEALNVYNSAINDSLTAYNKLVDILMVSGRNEKQAIEDARYVLPNATHTQFVVTANVRELLHFFKLRCCDRSQAEIRELADEILRLCREVSPLLFGKAGAPCVSGSCPEGKMSCGNPKKGV